MSTFDDTVSVVLLVLEDIGTPRSLMVKLLIEHGEWAQLGNLTVEPAHYLTADAYMLDASATEILRKFKSLPGVSKDDLRNKAFAKWLEAEKLCAVTNARFANYLTGFYPGVDGRLLPILDSVRKRIRRLLGPLPKGLAECRHGKGATHDDTGQNCTVLHKMQSQPTMTHGIQPLLLLLEESAWFRALTRRDLSVPKIVRGNRFTTVPKTIKGDRSIGVEPSVNIFLQLGVGSYVRRRLKAIAGIDLDEGQSVHRALAQYGSSTGALATIDLSSASDTVARNVVKYLLPEDWASFLEMLRSPTTTVKREKGFDGTYVLEKHSSMGNGYTFELETLIFWAIAREFSIPSYVYGDDIIVSTESARVVLEALKFFGFVPNPDKCFVDGPFRESCGGDYFNGQNVRPFYMKEEPNEPHEWVALANGLFHLGTRVTGSPDGLAPCVRRAYLRCLGFIPSDIRRIKGPPELGDVCLATADASQWRIRVKNSIRYIETYQPVTKRMPLSRFDPDVQLAAALYGVPSQGAIIRDSVSGYRKRWVPWS
ncbi:RNA-directed RNA polymerase [ssRNA phage SRR6960803_11]|uniref:RNA-directed RNA polymerase n=1 Tax=ssRNA phage SRR6960803_11 TaxID=2786614 RepID=A0A8S5KZW9_9VIRU|nr:RNA-directed RNA polymerase [ssRNA phage SRR6960803_11]DAD50747.1 TPA_asm: RNA-directed RNA polymerase [ssRNA phage SRR6960803_11]